MVCALLAFASLAAAPTKPAAIDIAYIARYYYRDSRRSSHHLYVCALNGTGRREVTVAEQPWDVQWVDRSHLAWIEGTFDGPRRLYVSETPFSAKQLVKSAKDISFPDSTHVQKGTRIACTSDGRDYWLSSGSPRLVVRTKSEQAGWKPSERPRKDSKKWFIDLQRSGVTRSFRWTNPDVTYKVNYGADAMDDYSPNCEFLRLREMIGSDDSNFGWAIGHDAITAHEGVSLVFALDWKAKTARLLPLNVEQLSIAPHRKLLVGSGGRLLWDHEWTSQITVANLKTGKWRYIVKGLVRVGPVALRP
jgi:hypothetical protein